MDDLDNELIEKYLSGTCSEAEIDKIFQWIQASENNKKELLKLRNVLATYYAAKRYSHPEHISHSYNEILRTKETRERTEKDIFRKVMLRVTRYAACILLVAGLSFLSYKYVYSQLHPEYIVVSTGNDEISREITLDDSTQIWIAGNSRITYPKVFSRKERKVFIDGKAFFKVRKDAKRPFFVQTDAYAVKVLGTSFEVHAFNNKLLSDVILEEGSVEILDDNCMSLCKLKAGQQFEFNKKTGQFQRYEIDAQAYTAWKDKVLEFDGMTFEEIIKIFERYYNVRIVLDDTVNKNQKFVGSLRFAKNIREMMKKMELVTSVRYDVDVNTIVYIK